MHSADELWDNKKHMIIFYVFSELKIPSQIE